MAVVFVYGTLTDPQQVSRLLEEYRFGPSAVCHGLQRIDGRYPTLVPGGQVAGRLLVTNEVDRLDEYEGLDRGLYCRVSAPLVDPHSLAADENRLVAVDTAEIYIGNPTAIGVSKQTDWPEAGPFNHCVKQYVETNNIRIEVKENQHSNIDDS